MEATSTENTFTKRLVHRGTQRAGVMLVALARPFWPFSGGLWVPRISDAHTGELEPCHPREARLALSRQAGRCGQEARGPPGKPGLGAQHFQAC